MRKVHIHKYFITVSCICVACMLIPVEYRESFYLNFELAYKGEIWRYISGHFTHHSWIHCIVNLAGLYLLFIIFPDNKLNSRPFSASLFIICIISLGLATISDEMKWYVGYSGVLVGLLSYYSIRNYSQHAVLSFASLLVLTTYIASQTILFGELAESRILTGIDASSYAHLFGLSGGIIFGLLESLKPYVSKAV